MLKQALLAGAVALGVTAPIAAQAAKIDVVDRFTCGARTPDGGTVKTDKCAVVVINGRIEKGDDAAFERTVKDVDAAIVLLNSNGGHLMTGLAIGAAIHDKAFNTAVPKTAVCVSACAGIWLAGAKRLVQPGARIGFHAAYYKTKRGRAIEHGAGNAVVGAYYAKLGLSYDAIIYLTTAAPDQMQWLTVADAKKIGLDMQVVD